MSNHQRWQTYDLIKLGIAILIVLIAVLLLFGSEPDSPDSASPQQEEAIARIAEEVTDPPEETITPTPSATPDFTPPTISPTITITPTLTSTPTQSPTPTPTATVTPTITAEPEDVPISNEDQDLCSLAIEPRLSVGDIALVRTNLNFRTGPGLDQKIQMVHLPGVRLEVIDGPVCIAHLDGAYRWWQVQRPDGSTGWSAEGSLTRFFYFLEPVR